MERKKFNEVLSSPHVHSEHTIGILKGRWPFLCQIRMRIRKTSPKKDMKQIIKYVKCCCILHNMLLNDTEVVEQFDDNDQSIIDANNVLNQPHPVAMRKDG